ncbi:thioredoxin [Enterococcus mundtii]|uniref:thioredoxin family protein n=1 Tax=Enterococcus mundtii TaxID=53346 RepID=UPI000D3431D0|nr:thioredoxin family protein [Enterococcus mundtii]PTO40338.1 thioredoxin [Enterococcus mundtii]PTO45117.1 thioredoxin [Enterococcus mundtii]
MKETNDLPEVLKTIQEEPTVVVAISTPNCSVCHAVVPKLEQLLTHYSFPAYHLDAFEMPEVASTFQALTAPVILLFHFGKEVERQARFIQFEQLIKRLDQLNESSNQVSYDTLFDQ